MKMPSKGPYAPTMAGLGGTPIKTLDDPITAVFLFLFLCGAITHMTILQINLRRGTKFIMSGMMFGFCMARITTCTMRLVWSTHPHDLSVAIAAQIFVAAGVILLFVINLIFTQRVLRACHPHWAWTKWFSLAFKLYYASIVIMLIALITCTVQSFYTLSHNTRRIDRDVQLVGSTYFAVAAFMPLPLLLLVGVLPKQSRVEKFGQGRFRTKVYVLVFSSMLLTLGAAFRSGIAYVPKPLAHPAWYHSKACFYIFNFTIELTIVALYAIIRVDKRFHVPNGSHKAGDYSGGLQKENLADRVMSEEMVFDDEPSMETAEKRNGDVEAGTNARTVEN
ncbi:hypothetical protein LARI1_G009241 [Lachnellula arida]|uniref:Family c-likeg--coupled receptor protein n=1 Tax=Lachnellula arida TaxID=1316785 RepID=A0A8T9AY48_9HELO|nr:hypothetical protein LARI1_G009241 [Lachnellula arida]